MKRTLTLFAALLATTSLEASQSQGVAGSEVRPAPPAITQQAQPAPLPTYKILIRSKNAERAKDLVQGVGGEVTESLGLYRAVVAIVNEEQHHKLEHVRGAAVWIEQDDSVARESQPLNKAISVSKTQVVEE